MKKFISIITLLLITLVANSQNIEVISQTNNSITLRRTYTAVETYKKTESSINQYPGSIGIAIHGSYNFRDCMDFGGSLFYNFGGNRVKGKFGVSAGYDYGACQWWKHENQFENRYMHGRAGIIICKYLGVGAVFGKAFTDEMKINDYGAYTTLYLPVCKYLGFNIDGKWTKETYFTVGGGLIFTIPTKL